MTSPGVRFLDIGPCIVVMGGDGDIVEDKVFDKPVVAEVRDRIVFRRCIFRGGMSARPSAEIIRQIESEVHRDSG